MPRVLMIAGPHGAGKTTFATEFLSREAGHQHFVNADLIAGGLDPLGTGLSAAAGRLMLRRLDELTASGQSFAFETTLAGRAPLRWIRGWRQRGYCISLLYLRLSSATLAIERVRSRVEQGGHHVSEAVIRRRVARSWTNFTDLYRPLVDRWMLFDNSGEQPILIEASGGADPPGAVGLAEPPLDVVGFEVALHRAGRVARRREAAMPLRRAEARLDAELDAEVRARVLARYGFGPDGAPRPDDSSG